MITLLPHSRRIGYRAKRKTSWKKLNEFVHGQMRSEISKLKTTTKEIQL